MKKILQSLFNHETLSYDGARDLLHRIASGEFTEIQLASFLTVFRMRPITPNELRGFRDGLLDWCVKIDIGHQNCLDIVGTGGDGKNTFNISTLSAIVIAASGYQVLKHGNYSVSSACGSSDVLEYLGYEFPKNPDAVKLRLDKNRIAFIHAPYFHPAMKTVAPVRRGMGVKTFFNMLGPLVHPAQPPYNVFGVYSYELSRLYQYILQEESREFAVVYDFGGYDEVSLTGQASVRAARKETLYQPEDFGWFRLDPSFLFGGNTVEEAAKIFTDILANKGTDAQRQVVTANAGLAIQMMESELSLKDAVGKANETIVSGKAAAVFKDMVK